MYDDKDSPYKNMIHNNSDIKREAEEAQLDYMEKVQSIQSNQD